MSRHQNATALKLAAVLLLAAAAAPASEARVISRINHRYLFDISAACKATTNPKLCESVSAQASSARALADAVIIAAAAKAKEAQALSAKLMNAPGTDKMLKQSLDICRENFESAADSLQEASGNLKVPSQHADLMDNLSAAVSFVETCNDAFVEQPGLVSPVAHMYENMRKWTSDCLDLASELK
ncbi:hypothetical protein Cni_G07385 [Canna indica]|uniref:Pectinesterase inhibitor domain-containing protein n=1 Tax=Canna indica TaxID=4628 RepID=A0AAQ3JYN0_9LILI|nr:hypothetical protein Cni_G07385 [Canna indica]